MTQTTSGLVVVPRDSVDTALSTEIRNTQSKDLSIYQIHNELSRDNNNYLDLKLSLV